MLGHQPFAVDLHQRQCQAVGQHGAVRERKIGKARAEQEIGPVRNRLLVAHLDLDTCGQLAEIRAHAVGAREEVSVEPNIMASLVYSAAILSASPELKVCSQVARTATASSFGPAFAAEIESSTRRSRKVSAGRVIFLAPLIS